MAAGKQQQQGVVAAGPSVARRMWRVVRAVLYMLRRGLPSGRKLAMDLHLLLHRGKIAGKALGDLFLAFHHGHSHGRHAAAAAAFPDADAAGPFSCRALDPSLAVHEPAPRARREVEFSCSNTPSAANTGGLGLGLLGAGKRRRRSSRQHRDDSSGGYLQYYNYDAAEVARVFDMLNNDDGHHRLFSDEVAEPNAAASSAATSATPSPAHLLYWARAVDRSPAMSAAASRSGTPRLIPDSPAGADGPQQVDRQADEFIRRFYEQLRAQRSAASTPDYYGYSAANAASPYSTSRSPRPVTAGIIA
ncbi:hypothetical protein BAE44_0025770 [Dichanthelium oligosanthes]|uniref:Uncharacterized protein n=1 Tax=Dichanthelium oligosanthes TaxID=888268 RepID=A0A1E5UK19_9POAL|nr:hypothetical protein BAE44_0025770 [Dichanthelium oligosanthes]